jgi:hypothetical protein
MRCHLEFLHFCLARRVAPRRVGSWRWSIFEALKISLDFFAEIL